MDRIRRLFGSKRESSRGQAMVEMAMTFPLVFAIILLVMELGFAFNAYTTVVSAVRQGARAGAVYLYDPDADPISTTNAIELNRLNREMGQGMTPAYLDNVRDTIASRVAPIRFGSSSFDKGSSRPSEPTGDITVTYTPADMPVASGSGNLINVSVVYHYRPLTAFFGNVTIDMRAQSSERME